ncbi:hypothetical protein Acsp03_05700 [Actinomadura sp. NBRC 104412]|nr:hypothetical protein Acsp03_05700 [Actinomadura sp. NBRC 104412]
MELVSVLNGEPWSDHPRCVDPVLAAVARTVNDVVAAPARERLVALAPDMIGTARAGGPAAARLVARCAEQALKRPPHDPSLRYELEWDLRHARRRLGPSRDRDTKSGKSDASAGHGGPAPPRPRRWRDLLERRKERRRVDQAAAQVTFAVRAAAAHSTDEELLGLLRDCIADLRPAAR